MSKNQTSDEFEFFDLLVQRWKEQYFVNVGTDCGLTIAGFYYVCFSCSDGSINGYYYDPNSRYLSFILLLVYEFDVLILCFVQNIICYCLLSIYDGDVLMLRK